MIANSSPIPFIQPPPLQTALLELYYLLLWSDIFLLGHLNFNNLLVVLYLHLVWRITAGQEVPIPAQMLRLYFVRWSLVVCETSIKRNTYQLDLLLKEYAWNFMLIQLRF